MVADVSDYWMPAFAGMAAYFTDDSSSGYFAPGKAARSRPS
jgi:hypothetical protein